MDDASQVSLQVTGLMKNICISEWFSNRLKKMSL